MDDAILLLPWPQGTPGTASLCTQHFNLKCSATVSGEGTGPEHKRAPASRGSGSGLLGRRQADGPALCGALCVHLPEVNQPLCGPDPGLPPVGAEMALGCLLLPEGGDHKVTRL